jgi:hypothetical protein
MRPQDARVRVGPIAREPALGPVIEAAAGSQCDRGVGMAEHHPALQKAHGRVKPDHAGLAEMVPP